MRQYMGTLLNYGLLSVHLTWRTGIPACSRRGSSHRAPALTPIVVIARRPQSPTHQPMQLPVPPQLGGAGPPFGALVGCPRLAELGLLLPC